MKDPRSLRLITGRVSATGDRQAGRDFSSSKSATGTYILVFPPDFHPVALHPTCASTGAFFANAGLGPPATVYIISGAGAATDASFSFTAVGY